ncbi:MAG TPA: hypothetical protein VKT49_26030 [Bryobacteraceae bacterium]|nr:hypothetical protein [Bryobacteraceae bacterium]
MSAPLEVVRPVISDGDGGAVLPASFEHVPGETLFFFCRVGGFQKTADEKIHLAYTIEAEDPKGVPIMEPFRQDIMDEVTPQDKDWMPRIQTEVMVPPLAGSGTYKITVKVEDLVAKTHTESSIPFLVRGRDVAPSDTLTVRNFQFFRSEDDTQPVEKAAYRPGDGVWTRFDITGFKYGAKNKIDVSYVTSVITDTGKVLWTQPQAAVEQSESFYPKRYVSASMGITLQKNIRPGTYTIAVQVNDMVGNQTYETKQTFSVE